VALYERAGYVREGYRHDHYSRAGRFYDAILMARVLG
jgi:RimJ/RimL family protein N-acetyltransferase